MKRLLILVHVAIISFLGYANPSTAANINYSKAFIFNEQGVEFAVFPDGQFDFNILDQHDGFYNSSYDIFDNGYFDDFNISYNSGYGYNPYLQFDDFGAIVQIQHVPIYYDYYGRVKQIGPVRIRYNYRGFVQQIGRMYVNYNSNLSFHCHGYINTHNRFYTPQPWHHQYRRPNVHLSVVNDRPYRRHYTPNRRHFTEPFSYNHRPNVQYHINGGQSNAVVLNNGYRNNNATIRSQRSTNTAVQTQHNRSLTRSMDSRSQRNYQKNTVPSAQTRSSVQRLNNPRTRAPQTRQQISAVSTQTRSQSRPQTVLTPTRSTTTRSGTRTRSQTQTTATRSSRRE